MSSVFASESSFPASPSLESMASSRAPSPFSGSVSIEAPLVQAKKAATSRHSQFYFEDGSMIFLVENTLYNVHRYFFQRDSAYFRSEFQGSLVASGAGVTDENPFFLPDIKSDDFNEFLCILYPSDFRRPDDKTTAQWTSILHLAVRWGFDTIKLLSTERLTSTANPIDKIVLGRRYGISEWLAGAYEAVCTRAESLTIDEGTKLGMEETIRISAVRQAYGSATARYDQSLLPHDLGQIFELPGNQERENSVERDAAAKMKDLEEKIAGVGTDATAVPPTGSPYVAPCGLPSTAPRCHTCPARSKNTRGIWICCDERCSMCKDRQETAGQRLKREQAHQLTELKARVAERDRQRLSRKERVSFFR